MGFAKVEALLQAFRLPHRFRSNRWELQLKRTYIFPTGFGFAFGLLALVQLMLAIASQNNLIYLFVFSEISVALASMFFTNHNIQKIDVESVTTEFCFAEESNWVTVNLRTLNQKPSYQLNLRWASKKDSIPVPPSVYHVQIAWVPRRRGRQNIPRLTLESTYPFSLLRAWKFEKPDQQIIVFPCRRGNSSFPTSSLGDRNVREAGLFYDLRPYQRGDSPKRIDWKASQRSQQMLIRRFEEESDIQLDFHGSQVADLPSVEDQISQLALWVDKAERQGAAYSLQVGSWNSGRSRGPAHWALCMEKLALIEGSDLT